MESPGREKQRQRDHSVSIVSCVSLSLGSFLSFLVDKTIANISFSWKDGGYLQTKYEFALNSPHPPKTCIHSS